MHQFITASPELTEKRWCPKPEAVTAAHWDNARDLPNLGKSNATVQSLDVNDWQWDRFTVGWKRRCVLGSIWNFLACWQWTRNDVLQPSSIPRISCNGVTRLPRCCGAHLLEFSRKQQLHLATKAEECFEKIIKLSLCCLYNSEQTWSHSEDPVCYNFGGAWSILENKKQIIALKWFQTWWHVITGRSLSHLLFH